MRRRGVVGAVLALVLVLAPASAAIADDTAPDPAASASAGTTSGASDLTWTSTGRTSAQLSWDAPAGASGTPVYSVEISTTTPYVAPRDTSTSATTLEVDGLPPGSHTTAIITLQDGTATTSSVWTQPAVAPSAPASVRTTTAGSASAPAVSVDWKAPTDSGGATVVSYTVQVSAVEAPTTVVASAHVANPSTSAVIAKLRPDTAYFASVRAVNAAGTSAAKQSSPTFTLAATPTSSASATPRQPQQQTVAAPVVTPQSATSPTSSPAPAPQPSTATVANAVPTVAALPLPVAIAVAVMALLFGACVVGLIAIRRRPWYR